TLPQTVLADEARAEYSNGVLRVTLPKREETKSRRIEVTGEGTASTKKIETKTDSAKAKASSGS
ncbi:MAG: hypothetical protein DMF69_08175, partial [Acidobacteria bacterium]